ncbi:PqqD family protein [Georgenia yuyongxinii]
MKLRETEVTWREIDGELVVLDLARSAYLTTNRTGTLLLRLLVVERSVDELAAVLVREFGISSEAARSDVEIFIRQLEDKGLLAGGARARQTGGSETP